MLGIQNTIRKKISCQTPLMHCKLPVAIRQQLSGNQFAAGGRWPVAGRTKLIVNHLYPVTVYQLLFASSFTILLFAVAYVKMLCMQTLYLPFGSGKLQVALICCIWTPHFKTIFLPFSLTRHKGMISLTVDHYTLWFINLM